jgi:hypothetical protein
MPGQDNHVPQTAMTDEYRTMTENKKSKETPPLPLHASQISHTISRNTTPKA